MNAQLSRIGANGPSMSSMEFAIQPFAQIRAEWAALADSCPEATLYQRNQWLTGLMRVYGLEFKAATLRDRRGHLTAACLLARRKSRFVRRWTSLPCSDSSPPLAQDDDARKQLLGEIARSSLAFQGLVEIRGWDAPAPWRKADCFADWRLDLDRPWSAIKREMDSNFRRQLTRGLERSFEIEVDRGLGALRRFYRLTLETRHRLGVPAQPWSFFRSIFEAFESNGDLEIWTVSQRGQAIASAVIIRDGQDVHYKWSARRDPTSPGASHCLLASILEKYAQDFRCMHLGRTDIRNVGLNRFKKETGAKPEALPYSFLPAVPSNVSSEVLGGYQLLLSRAWRQLPLPVTRLLGSALYRYLV